MYSFSQSHYEIPGRFETKSKGFSVSLGQKWSRHGKEVHGPEGSAAWFNLHSKVI